MRAQILIISQEDGALAIAARRLDDAGFQTIFARSDDEAEIAAADFLVEGVVIDSFGRGIEETIALAKRLIAAAPGRHLPIIAITDTAGKVEGLDVFSSILRPPVHPAQIVARIRAALRHALMEEEAEQRMETLAHLTGEETTAPPFGADEQAISILFAGAAAPQFIALKNALEKSGAEVTAALTSFTAFDCLHERDFDAIVLNVIDDTEPGFTIAAAMRRNTRLYHLPAIMLINPKTFTAVDEAFARGASDLLDARIDEEDARQRILSLAHDRRRHQHIQSIFETIRNESAIESETGLFQPAFFMRHLARTSRRAKSINRPLSLALIRVSAPPGIGAEYRDSARRQLGGMLRHLVRAEDMAARLDQGAFAILMPGASEVSALQAARRIEGVIDCTAFESGNDEQPFQLELEVRVVELRARETSESLLERALDS